MDSSVNFKGAAVTEQDRQFTKSFGKGEEFSILIPLPFDKISIAAGTTRALGGHSQEQVGAEVFEYTRMVVTLNTVVSTSPQWWSGAENCPDDNYLFELWRWYLDCEKNFTDRLKTKVKTEKLEKQ
jgi:hypothetical protein